MLINCMYVVTYFGTLHTYTHLTVILNLKIVLKLGQTLIQTGTGSVL